MPSKSKRASELLKQTNFSQPTAMRSAAFPEPKVAPPPSPPPAPKHAPVKPKGIDRFELEKHKFKVDLFELLRLYIPTDMDRKITRGDKASFYLIEFKDFENFPIQEFRDRETQLKREIEATEAAVKAVVLATGASAFGTHWQATITAPCITCDNKGMAVYSALHPDVLAYRKVGEPSVQIRARSQRRG